ncbi:papain-like cysteine peptidase [Paenibacillus larvae]|nr:hypothetical protein [Paenibacillus larvae]MCY9511204.1 papain-like cysteine peptidase [Paenibacillus larvae]MCY9527078.1 papain-like cysteine peptidase [Paenibacillus larvae]
MELKDIQRSYAAILSLGYNCQVAYQLRMYKLRSFAGLLDCFNFPDTY